MLKLLVRDFRVVRWDLWLLAAIYAVMAIPASRHAQALFVVGVALAIVLVVAVPGLVPDETFFRHLADRRFPATNWRKPG